MSDHEIAQPKGPHRWQKGQPSPNPKGRPRAGLALAERIRERLDPDVLIDLAKRVAADETLSESARIATLLPLYDRGYIKPPTTIAAQIETTTVQRDYSAMPLEERRALLDRIKGLPARVQNPKVLDGGAALLPIAVAHAVANSDEE